MYMYAYISIYYPFIYTLTGLYTDHSLVIWEHWFSNSANTKNLKKYYLKDIIE